MGSKECYTCKVSKPFKDFCKHSGRENGITNTCKLCKNTARRKDYATWDSDRLHKRQQQRSAIDKKTKHRDRRRIHSSAVSRFAKYGITKEDYIRMLKEQDYTCAVCDKLSNNGRTLSIDHCHATGKVRGLLCNSCNSTLGMSRDSIDRLEKCIKYLKKEGSYEF